MPAWPLLFAEHHLGQHTPYTIRRELRQRAERWEFTDQQLDWMIHLLIRDLKSDQIDGNARNARWLLQTLDELAVPALHETLLSADWQQRIAAAGVLRAIDIGLPSDDLIRVTIESFRKRPPQTPPYSDDWWIVTSDPGDAWLVEHVNIAETQLVATLNSDDSRQQLHCAAVLANAKRTAHLDRIAPILIEHLRDNHTRYDAQDAELALTSLGVDAIRSILAYRESADAQQRERVELIIRRFADVE